MMQQQHSLSLTDDDDEKKIGMVGAGPEKSLGVIHHVNRQWGIGDAVSDGLEGRYRHLLCWWLRMRHS